MLPQRWNVAVPSLVPRVPRDTPFLLYYSQAATAENYSPYPSLAQQERKPRGHSTDKSLKLRLRPLVLPRSLPGLLCKTGHCEIELHLS